MTDTTRGNFLHHIPVTGVSVLSAFRISQVIVRVPHSLGPFNPGHIIARFLHKKIVVFWIETSCILVCIETNVSE